MLVVVVVAAAVYYIFREVPQWCMAPLRAAAVHSLDAPVDVVAVI